ncbi:MAG: YihY/virulence factor BrkB family protein [Pseudolabrys sp.]|nr:YihY/virulence factor BrkB family protein [Pseudolabrys sp.]MDP2296115.1 YihY/virulence factor BrkB family protein [Pseudolabrys sp.]
MGLINGAFRAFRRSNKPALLSGLALVATYAAARALETGGEAPAAAAAPAAAQRRGWSFWKHVLYRTYEQINDDRLLALAAGVVFYGLLAIFPAITALVSSYALFAKASTINNHLASVSSLMPQGAYSIVDEQVTRIVTSTTGKLGLGFLGGLALALWSANAGVKAIIDALNIAYGVKERRSFIRLNLVSLAFTVGALVALLLALAAIVVLPVILSYLPLYGHEAVITTWLRWPALLLLAMLGLAVLFRYGPNRRQARWQFASVGAIFAAFAWIAGSAMLSWYLGSFADYDATYGSLGAGIGLMMWLWMTAIVVLVGAELNSEIEAAQQPVPRAKEDGIGSG